MHKYREGQIVVLTVDYPTLDLWTGTFGVVEVLYTTQPPMYEVLFYTLDDPFDMPVLEEELQEAPDGANDRQSHGALALLDETRAYFTDTNSRLSD